MGGDGGVIASNRKYMRGAGTANHTGDVSKAELEKESSKQVQSDLMTTCYLTKQPLGTEATKKQQIVADAYGRLYHKEAAVEALLRRKTGGADELGSHIRGLKDLYPVHMEISTASHKPVCPVTSVELNGWNVAVYLIPSKKDGTNVISDRAIQEMGKKALQEEYGTLDDLIQLAPPPTMWPEIQKQVQEKHTLEKGQKSKSGKKRKAKDKDEGKKTKMLLSSSTTTSVTDAARQRVQTAVQGNEILSSLFTNNDKKLSGKERADNLFALNT